MRETTEQGGTPGDVGRRRFIGTAAAGGVAAWTAPAILGAASATAAGTPAPGALRVVLSWNEMESDLDLHMSGPDGNDGRFHAYFFNPTPVPHVSLENDDAAFGGPETMTITVGTTDDYVPGQYRVWVHDFQGGIIVDPDPNFIGAEAVITFFDLNGQVAEYRPTDQGHTGDENEEIWRVFDFSIDVDGNVTEVTTRFLFEYGTVGTVY